MAEKYLKFSRSFAAGTNNSAAVAFGVDLLGAPVYLDARVIPATTFAKFMLALGKVVSMQDANKKKDNSAYQAWVHGEYLKELGPKLVANLEALPKLLKTQKEMTARKASLIKETSQLLSSMQFPKQRQAYLNWLYGFSREAWIALDPIVSVQPDATFFEAFSLDESTYARVTLPHRLLESSDEPICGTTNIDFSLALEREFARARSYRDLHLTVGSKTVSVDLGVSSVQEKKIDLPMSWVRGLVEVQAALSLDSELIELSSSFVADLIARLQSEREKTGPRHLLFILEPGLPVRVRVEPWGEEYIDLDSVYSGSTKKQIKFWGRRRIRVLENLLPLVEKVTVRLIDSGMPSFWSATVDGVKIDIGLSGWTSQNWAGKAKFSALMPSADAKSPQTLEASEVLRTLGRVTVDRFSEKLKTSKKESQALLQTLCLTGVALYDADDSEYRWRQLFPEIDFNLENETTREERFGLKIFKDTKHSASVGRDGQGLTTVSLELKLDSKVFNPKIVADADGRVTYAHCNCSFFNFNKMRLGPCRHIVAVSMVNTDER
jgi:hypothetical protein